MEQVWIFEIYKGLQMIEQSIVSSWKNVYEVKENKRKEIHYEEL